MSTKSIGAVSKKRYDIVCPVCNKTFVAKSLKRKFCSDTCRQKRFINDKSSKALEPLQNKIVDLSAKTFLQDKTVSENGSDDKTVFENGSVIEKNVFVERTCENDFSTYIKKHHPDFVDRLVNEDINSNPDMRKEMDGIWKLWKNVNTLLQDNQGG